MAIFAFIDASGNPVPQDRDPYVVASVIARENVLSPFKRRIDSLTKAILGERFSYVEIHAKDIVQNKGDFRGLDIPTRATLLSRMIDIACDYAQKRRLTAVVVVVEKDHSFKPRDKVEAKEYAESLVSEAYKLLFERVIGFVEEWRFNQYLVVVVDETDLSSSITKTLQYELLLGTYSSSMQAAKRVISPPVFAPSIGYRLLQLADVIAYIVHRIHSGRGDAAGGKFPLRRLYDKVYDCILRRSRQEERVEGFGLKKWKYIYRKSKPLFGDW